MLAAYLAERQRENATARTASWRSHATTSADHPVSKTSRTVRIGIEVLNFEAQQSRRNDYGRQMEPDKEPVSARDDSSIP
jgi:hypothetical protein